MPCQISSASSIAVSDTCKSTFGAAFAEAVGTWTFGNDNDEQSRFPYRNSTESKYDFRLQPRENAKPTVVTWFDQDETGDYDPSAKPIERLDLIKQKRERLPIDGDEEREPGPKRPKIFTWQHGRNQGWVFPITLRFTSEKAKAFLVNTKGEDNWPFWTDSPSSSDPNGYSNLWYDSLHSSESSQPPDVNKPYQLRTRGPFLPYNDSQPLSSSTIPNVTLGHPAARGCKACLNLSLPCTLIQEGGTYPCEDCILVGYECELILPPAKKRSCQYCRRRRFSCSYLDQNYDHTQPCTVCAATGVDCVAGPATGRTRTGPAYDQYLDPTTPVSPMPRRPDRPFVNCAPCRKAKKWCSLRRNQVGPCKRCREGGTECTFESLRQLSLKTRLQRSKESIAPNPSPVEEKPDNQHNINGTAAATKIISRLPHPLLFNHLPTDMTPCNWCQDIHYGLLGIIPHNPSDGKVQSYGPSRMCRACTTERLAVLACDGHELMPLNGMDIESFDQGAVIDWILEEGDGKKADTEWEWCCVCLNAAFYGCGHVDGEDSMDVEEDVGCGLRFCEECAIRFVENEGDLEELIRGRMAVGRFASRADAELLLRDGGLLGSLVAVE
ncbi:MAG: hypothetical protein LQ351_003375 [Letrouitia transgressa]|nr:MAG: hypothetical protein LQ351_003375 [Letrouitia transgressa]